MLHETDIVNLLMGIFSLVIVIIKKKDFPRYSLFFYAYYAILCALTLNFMKNFFIDDLFLYFEHFCYALAGIFFAAGSYIYFVRERSDEDAGP